MKKVYPVLALVCVAAPCVLSAVGCADKAAVITPDKQKQFGTANQPMPPEAREAIAKMTRKGMGGPPPSAAAAAPKP